MIVFVLFVILAELCCLTKPFYPEHLCGMLRQKRYPRTLTHGVMTPNRPQNPKPLVGVQETKFGVHTKQQGIYNMLLLS